MEIRDHTKAQSVPLAVLQALRRNWMLILIVATPSLLITVFQDSMDVDGFPYWAIFFVDFLFWAVLGVVVYATILLGISGFSVLSVPTILRFYWRDVGLMVCALIPTALVAVLFWLLISALFVVDPIVLDSVETSLQGSLILAMAYVLCMLVLLSFVGTWLPSVVVGSDRRLSAAFARGEATFEATIVQLIVWVVPLFLVTAILYWVGEGSAVLPDGTVLWSLVAAKAAATALEILRLALVAVVLSRVYLAHEATARHDASETPARSGIAN